MPAHDGSVTRWLKNLGGENPSIAQHELFCRYFDRLVGLARQRLGGTNRAAEDEEDVALSAMDSFFRRAHEDQFEKLTDRNDLWTLLVLLVSRKAINQYHREAAQKRGGLRNQEQPMDGAAVFQELISTEPTADVLLQLEEEYNRRLNRLGCNQLRSIAELSLQGFTQAEIGNRLEISERTIRRKLYLIRREWLEEAE